MWKQIILPTLLVASLWLLASGATTIYIYWADQSYQRVLSENVTSIRAAGLVQQALWRTQAYLGEGGRDSKVIHNRLATIEERVNGELDRMTLAVSVRSEELLVSTLRLQFAEYRTELQRIADTPLNPDMPPDIGPAELAKLARLAEQMSATSQELIDLNQRLLDDATLVRERWRNLVMSARLVVLALGPLVGVALGWRISRRLQKSVARMNIILRDATAESELDLGAVRMGAREDLTELKEQVEYVVQRMKQVTNELQSARLEVLRSERLAAVGGLAAGVAHELRNPLTSVKLLLQQVVQEGHGNIGQARLRVILEETSRMEATIQGLLDFSRPPQLRRTVYDLRETLRRALNLVEGRARQQGVDLRAEINGQPLTVDGDPEQLHQVLVNLLLNGMESMEQGGTLTMVAATVADPPQVRVEVRDSGAGISADVLPRLFEPFVSAKEHGTGLGLAICRRIVVEHGGTIDGYNRSEGGAVFVVELPAPPT